MEEKTERERERERRNRRRPPFFAPNAAFARAFFPIFLSFGLVYTAVFPPTPALPLSPSLSFSLGEGKLK